MGATLLVCFLTIFGSAALLLFALHERSKKGTRSTPAKEEAARRKELFSRILRDPALQSPENRYTPKD
jgi:hypothetical protein